MKRTRSGYISVDVDVYAADVISEISDEDLLEEVQSRGLKIATDPEPLAGMIHSLHDRDHHGTFACCAYEICDAVHRMEIAEQLAERPNLAKAS